MKKINDVFDEDLDTGDIKVRDVNLNIYFAKTEIAVKFIKEITKRMIKNV